MQDILYERVSCKDFSTQKPWEKDRQFTIEEGRLQSFPAKNPEKNFPSFLPTYKRVSSKDFISQKPCEKIQQFS